MTWDTRRRSSGLGLAVAFCLLGLGAGLIVGHLAAPGSPSPSRPSAGPTQAATNGVPGVGPTRTTLGVPVGYERTPEGAAVAVGNYLAALGGRLALNRAASDAMLAQIADPADLAALQEGQAAGVQSEESLWGLQAAIRQGRRVLIAQTPIAFKLARYTADISTVSVWLMVSVAVDGRQRPTALFANGAATVAWEAGDWRLTSIDNGSRATDVVPACPQTPTPTGGLPAQLEGFTPYGS